MRLACLLGLLVGLFFNLQALNAQSTSTCDRVMRRFYECKNLKMRVNAQGEYEIDTSVRGNQVDPARFASFLSTDMTIGEALDLQRTVYESAYNCSSTLCRCVALKDEDLSIVHGSFFRNSNVYAQFKQIILDYVGNARKSNVASFCSGFNVLFKGDMEFYRDINTPSCVLDYGTKEYYSNLKACMYSYSDELNFRLFSRDMKMLNSRHIPREDVEKTAVCIGEAMNVSQACTPVEKRFVMVSYVPVLFNTFLADVTNLTQFVDEMSRKIDARQEEMSKSEVNLNATAKVEYWQYSEKLDLETFDGIERAPTIAKNQSVKLFSKSGWSLDGDFVIEKSPYGSNNVRLKSITVNSEFGSRYDAIKFNRTFDMDARSELANDCSILNPENMGEKIWIRAISSKKSTDRFSLAYNNIFFGDFKWNVSLVFNSRFLEISMPSDMARFASGLLVDGQITSPDSSKKSPLYFNSYRNYNNEDADEDEDS